MITIRSYNLFQPSAARTSSRFRPNPAINRWAIFNRPRNADSAEPIFGQRRSLSLPVLTSSPKLKHFHHHIDQPLRHDDHLDDLVAIDEALYFAVSQDQRAQLS